MLAIGAAVSSTGGVGGAFAELPAFALLALGALFFVSRLGALVLAAAMAALSVVSNHEISTSAGPTGREIGFGLLLVLLLMSAVVGIVVDVVVGLARRAAR